MSATPKTSYQAVSSALKRGPKKGLTASTIAERTALNLNTVRSTLAYLVDTGEASVIGTAKSDGRGRPSNLYVYSAA